MLKLKIKDKDIHFIGDPHLGLRFNHTPLHRVGDREKMQMDQFKAELASDCDICIMVGDLFDVFKVSNEVLLETYTAIRDAADASPQKEFVMMQGNHDISRQADILSSFDVLAELLRGVENIDVVRDSVERLYDSGLRARYFPYSAFNSALSEVNKFTGECDLVVGHWDTMIVAGDHNFVPLQVLKNMTNTIVTGHIHTPDTFTVDDNGNMVKHTGQGVTLHLTGSMQPYSHGQDRDGLMYVTHTVEQVEACLYEDPNYYVNKCLRIIIGTTEVPPDTSKINCLAVQVKRLDKVEEEKVEVVSEDFDFKKIFDETFEENEVPEETRDHYWNAYRQEAKDVS